MRRILFASCLFVSSSALACSGDDASVAGDDGGADAADVTVVEAGGEAGDANAAPDTSTGTDAGTDAATSCGNLTKQACGDCCKQANPVGAAVLDHAIKACACQPQYCGPTDAAAPDADAAVLGTGACTDVCENGDAAVPPRCLACAQATVDKDGGGCYASVSTACASSAPCVSYVGCTSTCR
jgi:hypothetical protein